MERDESYEKINGYTIYKGGSWCEISKDGKCLFQGNVDKNMTCEQIYQEVMKEVVFSLNGKELLTYDFLNEFVGERKSTIKLLAEENKCNEKDIKVSYRKPKIPKKVLNLMFFGIDNWDRPVYRSQQGTLFKDTNLGHGRLALYTAVNNDFYGEPDAPINDNIKVKIVNKFSNKENKILTNKEAR